jgi:hypothetical protein
LRPFWFIDSTLQRIESIGDSTPHRDALEAAGFGQTRHLFGDVVRPVAAVVLLYPESRPMARVRLASFSLA